MPRLIDRLKDIPANRRSEVAGLSDNVERKRFTSESGALEVKQVDLEGSEFEGYSAGIGNRDSGNDIIMPGAFSKTIRERVSGGMVKLLDNHERMSIRDMWGKVMEASEREVPQQARQNDDNAPTARLWSRFLVSRKQAAQDALRDIKDGILDGLSIGYRTVRVEYVKDDDAPDDIDPEMAWLRGMGARLIHELAWWETSLVMWGMNSAALVIPDTVKTLMRRARDFEEGDAVDEKEVRYAIRELRGLIGDADGVTGIGTNEVLEATKRLERALDREVDYRTPGYDDLTSLYTEFAETVEEGKADAERFLQFVGSEWGVTAGEQDKDNEKEDETVTDEKQDNEGSGLVCTECDNEIKSGQVFVLDGTVICADCKKDSADEEGTEPSASEEKEAAGENDVTEEPESKAGAAEDPEDSADDDSVSTSSEEKAAIEKELMALELMELELTG